MTLKEHRAPVTRLVLRTNDTEVLSASEDGSCLIWDLATGTRSVSIQAPTLFRGACYLPDDSQILTCGTDRQLTWWTPDGVALRELPGSEEHDLTALAIAPGEGETFVVGCGNGALNLWGYDEGEEFCSALAHSAAVLDAKYFPDGAGVVSCAADGSLVLWQAN
eukprot:gnl/Ergobibamus_cyprinoides/62.p2 GENE.gnl/Ergobibamus_cyprinoides/62~~gnl/Ergobibamus_cyprinoides/62.p2  ORF type:complete len:164 (+),score=28.15 gnl/Ergobibamus_cyprinoides/62:1293-1784(+)